LHTVQEETSLYNILAGLTYRKVPEPSEGIHSRTSHCKLQLYALTRKSHYGVLAPSSSAESLNHPSLHKGACIRVSQIISCGPFRLTIRMISTTKSDISGACSAPCINVRISYNPSFDYPMKSCELYFAILARKITATTSTPRMKDPLYTSINFLSSAGTGSKF
jgi:hypothetical protein